MLISITGNNEVRLITFIFTIKREKKDEKRIYIIVIKQTNKPTKWDINKRLQLEVAYIFNEQFTYLARTVFGNPTFNSCFKFLKRFGFFYFCRHFFPLVLDLQKMPFQCHTFQYMVFYGYIQTDSSDYEVYQQIQNTFHQFWSYSSFNFEYLSHQFLQISLMEGCRAASPQQFFKG